MVEEHREETSAGEVEVWVEQTSQVPLCLVGSQSIPSGFSRVSSKHPSLLVDS